MNCMGSSNLDDTSEDLAPAGEYSARLRQRRIRAERLQRRYVWIGNARIVVFAAIVLLWWKAARTGSPFIHWLVASILIFVALVIFHRQVDATIQAARRACALY